VARTSRRLPTETERRLAHALRRWASTQTLSTQQVNALRQSIVTSAPWFTFDWWWRLLDPVDGSTFRRIPGRSDEQVVPAMPPMLAAGLTMLDQEAASYQPYLRLI
jgi:hypothetical protein